MSVHQYPDQLNISVHQYPDQLKISVHQNYAEM